MSRKPWDLTGKRVGRLIVQGRSGTRVTPNGTKQPIWLCVCDCGNQTHIRGQALRLGTTKSCGCLQAETMAAAARTHGMSNSPEHQSWRGMRERVMNPASNHYPSYGGRGITICPEWESFSIFLRDMGNRPEGKTLDRYPNPNGNYGPDNCRWATPAEQSRNTTRTVHITWAGETLCREDWAARLGITCVALKVRLKRWSLHKAMTTPRLNRGRAPNTGEPNDI